MDAARFDVDADADMSEPGLYLHKHPVRGGAGGLLSVAGSVLHHVVLFVRGDDGSLTALEFGPDTAFGTDTTDDIMAEAPAGPVVRVGARPLEGDAPRVVRLAGAGAHHALDEPAVQVRSGGWGARGGPGAGGCCLACIGRCCAGPGVRRSAHEGSGPPPQLRALAAALSPRPLNNATPAPSAPPKPTPKPPPNHPPNPPRPPPIPRQAALDFLQGKPYHALKNNCIAAADFLVRVLTAGAVKSAPLIYDLLAGDVPEEDNMLLGMMTGMLGLSGWVAYLQEGGSSPAAGDMSSSAGALSLRPETNKLSPPPPPPGGTRSPTAARSRASS